MEVEAGRRYVRARVAVSRATTVLGCEVCPPCRLSPRDTTQKEKRSPKTRRRRGDNMCEFLASALVGVRESK